MKWISLLVFLLVFAFTCQAQQDTARKLEFSIVGWTLHLPADSKFLSDEEYETLKIKAVNAINSTFGTEETMDEVVPLFVIMEEQYNGFNSTINLHDSTGFDSWRESYAITKSMMVDVIIQQGDQIQLQDTASSAEVIDGIEFQRFYMKTYYPQHDLTLHTYWYFRKNGKYDFSISISYVDEKIGERYLAILRNSTFKK